MLKVDEEGQIEDDGADQQVSLPSYRGDGARPMSLADRLTPLPDASAVKNGGAGPSHSNGSGYVSPRHMNLDRERDRDRDRYLETSPGPSSAFGASRSRYATLPTLPARMCIRSVLVPVWTPRPPTAPTHSLQLREPVSAQPQGQLVPMLDEDGILRQLRHAVLTRIAQVPFENANETASGSRSG